MDVARLPELIIGYDESSFPTSAVCSTCGEPMPSGEPLFPTPKENITWFKAQFDQHLRRWHKISGSSQIQ
jgi:hypothetical protein